jgi:hypothetical protein
MEKSDTARLIFTQEFDQELADLVEMKEWCGIGVVEMPDGKQIEIYFTTPRRLASDFESNLKSGKVCMAEPCTIIIPEVTRKSMEAAVKQLYDTGYFNRLLALGR